MTKLQRLKLGQKSMKKTKLVAAALAVALMVPPVASADNRTVTGNITQLSVSDIDGPRTVDLVIYKSEKNPYDDVPPGQLPDGGLAGFTFSLERVAGVDLTTQAGWDMVESFKASDGKPETVGPTYTAVTNERGAAFFEGLPIGLYYVTETPPDIPGFTWRYGSPFFITLPLGDVYSDGWDYEAEMIAKSDLTGKPGEPDDPDGPPPTTPDEPGEPGDPDDPPPGDPSELPSTTEPPELGEPGEPGTPPGTPGEPGDPPREPGLPRLAETGASVIAIAIAGLALVLFGGFLLRRRREEPES